MALESRSASLLVLSLALPLTSDSASPAVFPLMSLLASGVVLRVVLRAVSWWFRG
jgi:hypothetical protein